MKSGAISPQQSETIIYNPQPIHLTRIMVPNPCLDKAFARPLAGDSPKDIHLKLRNHTKHANLVALVETID